MKKPRQTNTGKPSGQTPAKSRKARPKAGANEASASPAPPPVPETDTTGIPAAPPPLPDTEMEVHHHPQLSHQPKPWKEYLLEGFMIFIAVMMGFIAENIRETITNDEHVRQLTAQLVQDLKTDTAQLNVTYKAETEIVNANNALSDLLRLPLNQIDMKKMQKLIADSHSLWQFHASAGAMAAIKNELHLKQFSNSEIISRFATYERHIELLQTVQGITLQYQRSFLDPFLLKHFTPENLDAAFNKKTALSGQMRNLSQDDLDQLAADIVLIRINSKELVQDNLKIKQDATELLQYVIEKYQPEGE